MLNTFMAFIKSRHHRLKISPKKTLINIHLINKEKNLIIPKKLKKKSLITSLRKY